MAPAAHGRFYRGGRGRRGRYDGGGGRREAPPGRHRAATHKQQRAGGEGRSPADGGAYARARSSGRAPAGRQPALRVSPAVAGPERRRRRRHLAHAQWCPPRGEDSCGPGPCLRGLAAAALRAGAQPLRVTRCAGPDGGAGKGRVGVGGFAGLCSARLGTVPRQLGWTGHSKQGPGAKKKKKPPVLAFVLFRK